MGSRVTTALSPDLPNPVDLTLHTVTETQLVDAMVAAMQVTVPEWEPQEGATEIILMEALALTMGQFIYALNQLPRVVMDGVIALHGITRNDAVAATGQITVTVSTSTIGTQSLPVGARFRVETDGFGSVVLLAVEDVTINPSDNVTAAVNVVAERAGSIPNGIPVGTSALMIDPYTWVESALVSAAVGGGGDLEADEQFYARGAAELQALSMTLVTDSNFATAALRNDNVGRAKAFGLWDGVGVFGAMPGHIAVAVAAPDGTKLTAAVKAAVQVDLAAGAVAGLQVHVVDFATVAMNLGVVYVPDPAYTAAEVAVSIEVELRSWLNPATWPLGDTLTGVNQILLRIGRVLGVANVTSVTGWAPITGGATLPSLASLTITAA